MPHSARAEKAAAPTLGQAPAQAPTRAPAQTPAQASAQADNSVFKDHVAGTDVTADFNKRYEQADNKDYSAEKAALRGYRVILVPGIVTGVYMRLGNFIKDKTGKPDVLDYLRDASQALVELGQSAPQTLLDKDQFNTQRTVAQNADRIVRAVQEAARGGKRVVLVSHSKGSSDTLAALLLMQKAGTLKNVGGWISIQGTFYGTPVADEIMKSDVLRTGAKLFFEQLGGTIDSLNDMTTDNSNKFINQHNPEIQQLLKRLPILCFASWKPKPADFQLTSPDTLMVPTRDMMAERGMQNDGLVPTKNAILPGTRFIAKSEIDHAEPAMTSQPPVKPSNLDRKKLTKTLVAMLLTQLKAKSGSK